MNDLLNNVLVGPIGWQIMWSVVIGVAILILVAAIDGSWGKRPRHRSGINRRGAKLKPPRGTSVGLHEPD